MSEHRDEWVSYCADYGNDGEPCDCAPDLREVVEERDRYRDTLGLLRGYVKFDSKAWTLINDALRPSTHEETR